MKACQDSHIKSKLFAYQRLLQGVLKRLLCFRLQQKFSLSGGFLPSGTLPSHPVGLIQFSASLTWGQNRIYCMYFCMFECVYQSDRVKVTSKSLVRIIKLWMLERKILGENVFKLWPQKKDTTHYWSSVPSQPSFPYIVLPISQTFL